LFKVNFIDLTKRNIPLQGTAEDRVRQDGPEIEAHLAILASPDRADREDREASMDLRETGERQRRLTPGTDYG
jgi:hypothetical protein